MKPTTETIHQEVKDFKETYKNDISDIKVALSQILEQAKKTNGRVTRQEVLQEECPARAAFKQGKITANIWNMVFAIVAVVAAIAAWMK